MDNHQDEIQAISLSQKRSIILSNYRPLLSIYSSRQTLDHLEKDRSRTWTVRNNYTLTVKCLFYDKRQSLKWKKVQKLGGLYKLDHLIILDRFILELTCQSENWIILGIDSEAVHYSSIVYKWPSTLLSSYFRKSLIFDLQSSFGDILYQSHLF